MKGLALVSKNFPRMPRFLKPPQHWLTAPHPSLSDDGKKCGLTFFIGKNLSKDE
jgi:hypothetical protein